MKYPTLQEAMKMAEWVAMHLHTKTDPKQFEVAAALVVLSNEIKLLRDAAAKKDVTTTPLKSDTPKPKIPEIIPDPVKEKPYLPIRPGSPWEWPTSPDVWPIKKLPTPPANPVQEQSCDRCGLSKNTIEYYGCQDPKCPKASKLLWNKKHGI